MIYALRRMSRKKIYFIFILFFTIYLVYYNFPDSMHGFNTAMISSLHCINSSLTSSSLMMPLISSESSLKTNYIINTEMCKMIEWPLFDNETRPLYRNHSGRRIKCRSSETKLLSVKRVNQTVITIENLANIQPIPQCFATELLRTRGKDSKVTFGKKFGPIKGSINLTTSNAIRLQCYRTVKIVKPLTKPKYNKLKIFEQIIPLIPEKKLKTKNFETVRPEMPNVLMLGIDSISWLNFKRHFILTESLAKKHNFYPIYGYNKIGDNTFPNLMAVLTGNFYTQFWNESLRSTKYFDDLPFVWKEFSEQNFITNLIEDYPHYSLFNYNRRGFVAEPTDYYLRPVSMAIDRQLKRFCYKDKMEIEFYYNYTYDFVNAMQIRRQKYFAFIFMAHLTHNNANYAGYADLPVYTLLSQMFDNNLLKDTILFLYSDHGIRFGRLRETNSGTLEERLPFVYIYVPDAFNTDTIHKNLMINSHRLTTPFDIYATLLHISRGKSAQNLSHGMSLFDEIPVNRSCDSEQISEHWCTCIQQKQINNFENISSIANYIVDDLNQLLEPNFDLCQKLVLNQILSAYESRKTSSHYEKYYLIKFNVRPSFAIFEATVHKIFDNMKIIGDISRLNEYGSQSQCIDNSYLQKYCFC